MVHTLAVGFALLSAILWPSTAHNFWAASCETQDLMNGIASHSVEFVESYEFRDGNWKDGTGTVCKKNKYRQWHVACLGGTWKTGSSYGAIQLNYLYNEDSIEDLENNVFFATLVAGDVEVPCCKKSYKNNQWNGQLFARNKVCNALFYCGADGGCTYDESLLA